MSQTDLIDRYLSAVKIWLPRNQQKDILAELAEDLHSQIEDREAAIGHPLEETDVVALLKQRGSPMRVASGFIPEQRLINPAMVPIYRLVLKIVLLWVLAPIFVLVFIGSAFDSGHPGKALLTFLVEAWRGAFFAIGIVTTVFVLLDRYQAKWVDKWEPRKLPRVPPAHQPMQWYNDFSGFAFGIAGCFFWATMMWHRSAFVYVGGFLIVLAPVWGQLYWVILGVTFVRALTDLWAFLRPAFLPARIWMCLALDAAGILIPLLLLKAGNWIDIAGPNLTSADAAKLTAWLNSMIQIGLIIAAVIPLFDVIRQLRHFWRAKHSSALILTVSSLS
jgi:hypothetical protein